MPAPLMVDKEIRLTGPQEQVLLGSLLGDGSLNLGPRYDNAYYQETHSIKQRQYLVWKVGYLKPFAPRLMEFTYFSKHGGGSYSRCKIWTPVSQFLTKLRYVFYPNGKKIIPIEVLGLLNEFGLAVWFCDDGSYRYRNKSCCMCTDGYSTEEQAILLDWFYEKWGIIGNLLPSGKRYRIDFIPTQARKLIEIIKPFVPECMSYKTGVDPTKIKHARLKKRERNKVYYSRHLPEILEYQHRDEFKLKRKLWYQQHRDEINLKKRLWWHQHREEISLKRKLKRQKLRSEVLF